MKKSSVISVATFFGVAALAFGQAAPPRVATVFIQNAIISTQEGQQASKALETRFTPRKDALSKKQQDIANIQAQMRAGSATMSQAAKDKLTRDFDAGQKSLQREQEDFEAEVQQEEGKIMQDLGGKMMEIITKYAAQHGISMVVDVSNPQTPVLWADPSIDITNDVVKLYDQAHPVAGAAPATAKPAATPSPTTTKK